MEFNKIIDIDRFLPHSVDNPDLLDRLLNGGLDDVKTSLNENDFKMLPVASDYLPTRLTEKEIMELRKITDAKIEEVRTEELKEHCKENIILAINDSSCNDIINDSSCNDIC
jgi:hypothetical protein